MAEGFDGGLRARLLRVNLAGAGPCYTNGTRMNAAEHGSKPENDLRIRVFPRRSASDSLERRNNSTTVRRMAAPDQ